MKKIDRLKRELTRGCKSRKEKAVKPTDWLSSGSTTVNLAVSGNIHGAFAKGKYYHLFGTSDSGKTFLTLTSFAEASINAQFDDYRLIFDAPEDGYDNIDLPHFFGEQAASRIEPPRGTREAPVFSENTEDFFFNLHDALTNERPCLYVLDSFDALTSKQDTKKFHEAKSAAHKPKPGKKEPAGNMGMAKAKNTHGGMREVFNRLKKSKSILIIISQAKESFDGWGDRHYWSGGAALKFYCHAQLLTQTVKTITKPVNKKAMEQGIVTQVKVLKNRHQGRKTRVKVPIYWATGMDDVGGCVDYLLEVGHWKKAKGLINATELDARLKKEALISHVQENGLERELQATVGEVWEGIRRRLVPNRKNKYYRGE